MKDKKNTAIYIAYEDTIPFDPAQPERNLMRAILQSAMSDLRGSGEIHRQAKEFFLGKENEYLFSFQTICSMLEIDPVLILRKVGLKSERSTGVERKRTDKRDTERKEAEAEQG